MNSKSISIHTLILVSFLMFTAIANGQKSKNEPSVGENLEEISFLLNKDKQSTDCIMNTTDEELEFIYEDKEKISLIEDLNNFNQINLSEKISAAIELEMKAQELYLAPIKRINYKIDKPKN